MGYTPLTQPTLLYYDYINNEVPGEKVYLNINSELEKNKNDVVKPIKVALSNIEFKSKKFDKNKIKDFIFGKTKTSNEERKLFVTHKKTGLIVKINAATIDESLGKIKDYKDINKLHLLTNVKEIFENSEFILNYDDVKSGLQSQTYRFCSLVEINGKQYFALMTALDNLELKLYDFESFNKESTIKTIQQKQELQDSTNIIISDLIDFVKSKIVKKYNNDYRNAVKQNDKTIKLFQSAYHGSAKDFDRFDLSYALSGEGAMAHGYGVYTAKNKDVSEDYRKKLLPYDFDNIGMQITVNQGVRDVIYTKKATNTYGFSEDGIYEKRPDDYFNEALLYIEKTNNDKEKAIKEVQEKIDDYRENGDISNARFYLEVKEILQSYDFDITHNSEGMGQLFEVDIPECLYVEWNVMKPNNFI